MKAHNLYFDGATRAAATLALAVIFAAFPLPAVSQEAEIDPFDAAAFEESVEASVAPGGAAAASFLGGGSLLVRASATAPSALDGYAASAGLSGRVFAKLSLPDYGSFYAAYNLNQAWFAAVAGSGQGLLVPPRDLFAPEFSLSELHWSFDLGKILFIRLGNQLISWGPSRIWTPVDFINLQKANAFQALDSRTGKPGLRLHLPLPKANLFVFTDFSRGVAGGLVQDPATSLSYGGRLDATLGDAELGLTGWTGAGVQDKLGLDFSGRLLGFTLYGEAAWTPALDEGDEAFAASLGFSRVLGDLRRLTFSSEFFYNSLGGDYSGNPAAMLGLSPLYIGEYYAYLSLQAKELFSPSLSSNLSALVNLSDRSFSLKAQESFSFPGVLPFSLSLSWAGGGEGKEFTRLGGDNALSLGMELRAEF